MVPMTVLRRFDITSEDEGDLTVVTELVEVLLVPSVSVAVVQP